MEKLEVYIEELRKERDKYFEMSNVSATADSRGWLLNRIIGDLSEIANDMEEQNSYTKAAVLHSMISQ